MDGRKQAFGTANQSGLYTAPVVADLKGMWLPRAALTESTRGLWAAYVLVPGDRGVQRLERRQLEILEEADERIFVRGAIAAGERVAATGLQRLSPDQMVRVREEGEHRSVTVAGRD